MADAIADTTAGTVRGISEGGVRRFLGIPYAAVPVRARRFAPEPAEPWRCDATRPGPQRPSG
ncbi:carboxylesterase family protein [Rhizorhabdus wittichii]|uniref:carboxylesterase family protein n=1 Tax=Rhizorhabdus wittichii TaxID=160791 RepID=UPI0021F892FC|nr:carboxylesterase family protein [Rhizorhabdus wittichii]